MNVAVAERFARQPVAVSWVTTSLTDSAALVGVDAIAAAGSRDADVKIASSSKLPAFAAGAHVAILPAGRRVFFSGQAAPDPTLAGGTRKTMGNLGRTLEWIGATKADVVQVKAFIRPFEEYREAAREIAAFFDGGRVPTCIFVEWVNAGSPAEIEMIVAGRAGGEPVEGGIAFTNPPFVTPSSKFARIAAVDPGHPLIFISGLYGENAGSGRAEWLEIFGQLADILWETGSSMRHQVKGTYYSTTADSRRLHGEIRDVYFDPARPPASSGMVTKGTGRAGKASTIDMIAIPIPRSKPGS